MISMAFFPSSASTISYSSSKIPVRISRFILESSTIRIRLFLVCFIYVFSKQMLTATSLLLLSLVYRLYYTLFSMQCLLFLFISAHRMLLSLLFTGTSSRGTFHFTGKQFPIKPKKPENCRTVLQPLIFCLFYFSSAGTSLMLKLILPILSLPIQITLTSSPSVRTSSTRLIRSFAILEI